MKLPEVEITQTQVLAQLASERLLREAREAQLAQALAENAILKAEADRMRAEMLPVESPKS